VSAQHELARRATREQWLHQGVKNPHSAAHYGVYAFKPKMPLSLVDQGVDP
jgi:ABC-2 type transport system permease protein